MAKIKQFSFGFDYGKTISENSEVWEALIDSLLKNGHKVYIISGLSRGKRQHRIEVLKKNPVAYTKVYPLIYQNREEAPTLKWNLIKKLGIKFFVDDRLDTCEYLKRKSKGKMVVLTSYQGRGQFEDLDKPLTLDASGQKGLRKKDVATNEEA